MGRSTYDSHSFLSRLINLAPGRSKGGYRSSWGGGVFTVRVMDRSVKNQKSVFYRASSILRIYLPRNRRKQMPDLMPSYLHNKVPSRKCAVQQRHKHPFDLGIRCRRPYCTFGIGIALLGWALVEIFPHIFYMVKDENEPPDITRFRVENVQSSNGMSILFTSGFDAAGPTALLGSASPSWDGLWL